MPMPSSGFSTGLSPSVGVIDALVVLNDQPRSNENETIRSGQHPIRACVTTEKQEANAAVGFGYCEVN